jgi:anti-anti-sigma factor
MAIVKFCRSQCGHRIGRSLRKYANVPIISEQREGTCLIRLEGEVGIASAAELKGCLLEALASGREFRVDLQSATELDVTAMQLLWAAARELQKAGKGFTLIDRIPNVISLALAEAGLERFPNSAGTT